MRTPLTARRAATDGVLIACALVLGYLETLLPLDGFVPGVKLGLANIAALLVLYRIGPADALVVNAVRVILSNLMFGSLLSMLYGLCGGIGAVLLMAALRRTGAFGPLGVSVAGGECHNLLQLGCAALVMQSAGVFASLPVKREASFLSLTLAGLVPMLAVPVVAAVSALTPGRTTNGMPSAASASVSSARRPNSPASPPLRRTTRLPFLASSQMRLVISACVIECAPHLFPTKVKGEG